MKTSACAVSAARYLIPAIEIAYFDEAALLFLTESETFVTVNQAAADLMELLLTTFAHHSFDHTAFTALLLEHFDLDQAAAEAESVQLLETWSSWGVIQLSGAVPLHPTAT